MNFGGAGHGGIEGGSFLMGSEDGYPEEAPVREVSVDGFWIDRHAVTNRDWNGFVKETGHATLAERPRAPTDYPDADPDRLVPASSVFVRPGRRVPLTDPYQWWDYVPGADWRHPRGPEHFREEAVQAPGRAHRLRGRRRVRRLGRQAAPDGGRVEFAARGGLDGATYAWGDEPTPRRPATWRTPGRGSSRSRTSCSTGTSGPRRSDPSRRTATGSTR